MHFLELSLIMGNIWFGVRLLIKFRLNYDSIANSESRILVRVQFFKNKFYTTLHTSTKTQLFTPYVRLYDSIIHMGIIALSNDVSFVNGVLAKKAATNPKVFYYVCC